MTIEIVVVLSLVVVAVILFASEKIPIDLVALIVMAVLLASRIISPQEGLSGFSNPATVTVGAMFVLSAGLSRTGAVNFMGKLLTALGKRDFSLALITIMVSIGVLSAFINNTAVVAIFMPIVLTVARDINISASKLLMPLSFASMFGGVCTLIGTSTNILVSSIAQSHGIPGFGMFEFSSLGLIFFVVGILYMFTLGVRFIPHRRTQFDLTRKFRMGDYLTEIVLLPEAKSIGKNLTEAPLVQDLDIAVLEVYRNKVPLILPPPQTILQANDVLRVRCDVQKIKAIQEREGVALRPGLKWRDKDFQSEMAVLVEAVIAPNSVLEGKTLEQVQFRHTFGAIVLAIRHRGTLMRENLGTTPLSAGDALLIEVKRDNLIHLQQHRAFVIVSEIGLPEFRTKKILMSVMIIAGVVFTAATNILPIVVSAVVGSVLLVLTRCITLEETYAAIEWNVIFLLAGVLTLGIAMEKTGAAMLISDLLISFVGRLGPLALLSALFYLTMVLTNIMSNAATAALLAPIAIVASQTLGVNPKPLLMAVTFGASLSFMTPVGYQTNTLIYGPGKFRFTDFLRVGTPLNILFWILGSLLIPQIWPL
ncbi:SLC13 family permease [bacterium]|nr:SLC13 family permease [bacterium]